MSPSSISSTSDKFVRFYYGERTGGRFKAKAFDDMKVEEADEYEQHLRDNNIDYLRIEL